LIVRGVEGDPELSIAAATKVLDVQADRVFALTLAPKDVGVPSGSFREMSAPIPAQVEQEATLLKSILENRVQGAPRNWVVQNAAMLLYAAGRTSSISAGVPIAAHTIDTGAAAAKLQEVASAEPVGAHRGSDSSPS
jgi:anthranilate phosphoribosyltransferase